MLKMIGKVILAIVAALASFGGFFILVIALVLFTTRSGQSLQTQSNIVGFCFMAIVVVTAVLIYSFRGQSGRELKLVKAAEEALKWGDFEEACYFYAGALLRAPSQRYCKKHTSIIRELWLNHGPFTFDRWKNDLEAAVTKLRQEGDTRENCRETALAMEWVFHEILLEKIHEIAENKLINIDWPRRVKIIQEWQVTSGELGTIVRPAAS